MTFDIFRSKKDIDPEKYPFAKYDIVATEDTSLNEAAWQLAIGQSVGNPNVRNSWETDELFENHSCLVVQEKYGDDGSVGSASKSGAKIPLTKQIEVAFPLINTNYEEDGISHILCQLMGGQMDIDAIAKCQLTDIAFPESFHKKYFKAPALGLSGLRGRTGQNHKPFSGGIIKPKTGVSKEVLLDMVKELVEGGVDFIKEDEILADPTFCPLKDRAFLISDYLENSGWRGIYCFAINGDPHKVLKKAEFVSKHTNQGVHVNFWSGLGVYNSIREENPNLFIHFQKSGDKVITDNFSRFSISWKVLLKIAVMSGVDSIHAGMLFGYLSDDAKTLTEDVKYLNAANLIPALSCGMHPGLVDAVRAVVGDDFIANVGGALHGHPEGTKHGAWAMRQAIDQTGGPDFMKAVRKWGYKKP